MIYLLNADRAGADSVAHLVAKGLVTHIPIASYLDYQKAINELIEKGAGPDDVIVIDTLTTLAETTRGDMKLGSDQSQDIWASRAKLTKEDSYGSVYAAAATAIMRFLRNANNRGYRIITLCHEADQEDKEAFAKKLGPAVNAKFYASLIGACTDCMRLSILRESRVAEDGTVLAAEGTRVLQTTMDDYAICKYQVTPNEEGVYPKIPKYIPDPTMGRIFKVLNKKPSWLTIYGEPGSGKTTLACSEAFIVKKATATK